MSYTVLLPVLARDILEVGASGYGTMMSLSAVGALLSSLVAANLGSFQRKALLMFAIVITFGFVINGLAWSSWYLLSLALTFLAGASNVSYLTISGTLLLSLTPDQLRGRVMSLYELSPLVMHHLGGFVLGSIANLIGASFALSIGGLIVIISSLLIAIRNREVRQL
jgi:predicted MFS family arabinose efflux permease